MLKKIKNPLLRLITIAAACYLIMWALFGLGYIEIRKTLISYYHVKYPVVRCGPGAVFYKDYAPISVHVRSWIVPLEGITYSVSPGFVSGPQGYVNLFGGVHETNPGQGCPFV